MIFKILVWIVQCNIEPDTLVHLSYWLTDSLMYATAHWHVKCPNVALFEQPRQQAVFAPLYF